MHFGSGGDMIAFIEFHFVCLVVVEKKEMKGSSSSFLPSYFFVSPASKVCVNVRCRYLPLYCARRIWA